MFEHTNFFVLRRPLSPLNALQDFYTNLQQNSVPLAEGLRCWFSEPLNLQALEAASPGFYARVCQWLSGDKLPDEAKIISTLHKYMVRMTTRSTPYGQFAGCAVGTVGRQTRFQIGPRESIIPHTRLDMTVLVAVKTWLLNQPAIRRQLRLFTNNTLYLAGDYLRFIEQQQEATGSTYFISAVWNSDLLTMLFARSQHGITGAELNSFVQAQCSFTQEQASEYIDDLINSQLLQVEIEPTLTGDDDYLTAIRLCLERLDDSPAVVDARQKLTSLSYLLQARPLPQHELLSILRQMTLDTTIKDVVQVDTILTADRHQLSEQWLTGLQRQLEALVVFNQSFISSDLDEFKSRFYTRYEEEEIPLSMAIDHEMGVGYGASSALGVCSAPMVDTLSISESSVSHAPILPTAWQAFLLHRYAQALRCQQSEIILTDDDLQALGSKVTRSSSLPHSFYAFGTLLAESDKAVDENQYRFALTSCKGPSALNLISRFGYADPQLAGYARNCARQEEASNPDVIIAEVIHFPESRVGNILSRPSLYQYEIPYLGKASVAPEYQIPIADLYVSVRNDRLILRSKRLNKRVIPRLSNAHNFTNGLPVYQFLCNLQFQDAYLNLQWNWGNLSKEVYLPQVRYKNIVLSRATWHISTASLAVNCPTQLVKQIRELGVPSQFFITKNDNELRIDLTIDASVTIFCQEIRKTSTIQLTECLVTPECSPVRDKQGCAYAQEMVLPFRIPSAPVYKPIEMPSSCLPQRRFSIGSEWLYIKLYAGEKLLDQLLVDHLYPIVHLLFEQKRIQQFFFVRYKDPEPHLRIRFLGNPSQEFYLYVIHQIEQRLQSLLKNTLVYKIQVDTYQRELERYGAQNIAICERLFCCDSLSTLQFLYQTGAAFDENIRFTFAIYKIDRILSGLSIPISERHLLLDKLKEQFFAEFHGESALRKELNMKFRTYKSLLEHTLNHTFLSMGSYTTWMEEQQRCLDKLKDINPGNYDFQSLIKSLIHMLVNRLFPSKQRAYELVIYYCLAKYYCSLSAQSLLGKASN